MIQKIINWFRKTPNPEPPPEKLVETLLQKLIDTQQDEISCDEVHGLIDQFSELALAGADVKLLMPLMQKHITLCPDCQEEHEALLEALRYEGS